MTTDQFGKHFYDSRQNAWEALGSVNPEPLSAQDSFVRMGSYDVQLAPMAIIGLTPVPLDTAYRAIVRMPTEQDFIHRPLGAVKGDYVLITPLELCKIHDDVVHQPIETMGTLGNGHTFFMTMHLPDIVIKGDVLSMFLVTVSVYYGGTALYLMVTPVRMVCANMLMLSQKKSVVKISLVHRGNLTDVFSKALSKLHADAVIRAEEIKSSFDIMANFPMSDTVAKNLIYRIYPEPEALPPDDLGIHPNAIKDWEHERERVFTARENVYCLWDGAAMGGDSLAMRGTAWGLYNCVAEWENFKPFRTPISRGKEILFGWRRNAMQRAFTIIMEKIASGR